MTGKPEVNFSIAIHEWRGSVYSAGGGFPILVAAITVPSALPKDTE